MANPEEERWRELDARDHDRIRLLWNESNGQFRVHAVLEDSVDETPPLTSFEAAKDCFDHARASGTLGEFVMRNHAEAVAV